jgi:hypothetical protein
MIKNNLIGLFALLLLVAVQIPFIYSIECSQVSQANYNTCLQIKNMSLNDSDKDLIISNLDYSNKFSPDHQYVYDRNTNLVINDPPANVSKQQGIFVKNFWMNIFTVMPSVLYNNSSYVPNQTKIFTGYNYNFISPVNYVSPSYPNTNNGDCQRTYTLTKNLTENKVFVNNLYQGSGKLVRINILNDSEIRSIFTINVSYSIAHYSWQRYCSRTRKGICIQYSYRCQSSSNEIQQDNLQAVDSIRVRYYNNSLFANISTLSSYSGNTKFGLNFSNSVKTTFKDSSYTFNEFVYSINYSKAPYYVLTLRAEDYKQEQITNLFKQGNSLIVKNTNNCTLGASDFFYSFNKLCYGEQKQINFSINTDKLRYLLNDTIIVYIYPQNISVNITYGNQSKIAIGNTSFHTESLQNKITAFNESSSAERIIYVQEQDRFGIIFNFSIFGILNYALYAILRKCFGGTL